MHSSHEPNVSQEYRYLKQITLFIQNWSRPRVNLQPRQIGIWPEGSFDKQDFRITCRFDRWAPRLNTAAYNKLSMALCLGPPGKFILKWHNHKVYGKQLPIMSVAR